MIVIGLATYGYNIMKVLGNKITLHSPSRGFSMELGAAITVILASQYGLPVSTTMCITGSTIGVALCNGDLKSSKCVEAPSLPLLHPPFSLPLHLLQPHPFVEPRTDCSSPFSQLARHCLDLLRMGPHRPRRRSRLWLPHGSSLSLGFFLFSTSKLTFLFSSLQGILLNSPHFA
jgi:hypothetical protein